MWLQTNAEVGTSTTKLGILTFVAPDVHSCNFIHSKFNTDDNLLLT